jgi:hypothetical protein
VLEKFMCPPHSFWTYEDSVLCFETEAINLKYFYILNFYSNISTSEETPRGWSNAIITPIFKKRDKKDPKTTEALVYFTYFIK